MQYNVGEVQHKQPSPVILPCQDIGKILEIVKKKEKGFFEREKEEKRRQNFYLFYKS